MKRLTIHYRGPLTSCNYDCPYCPFAKDWEEPAVLAADRVGVERFVAWASAWKGPPLHVLFTPWGEALVRPWYREALVALSKLGSVAEVAAQTNLSMNLDWLADADRAHLALWTTWHPGQVALERFVAQTERLDALGIAHSVGVVGLHENLEPIAQLRERLPQTTYLWVNAYQREADYYTAEQRQFLAHIDPQFVHNRPWPSEGELCRAGHEHVTVDGEGDVRRCHFVPDVLGNLYRQDLAEMLQPRACPQVSCRCHIGYTNLPSAGQAEVYGDGLMARIPREMLVVQRGG